MMKTYINRRTVVFALVIITSALIFILNFFIPIGFIFWFLPLFIVYWGLPAKYLIPSAVFFSIMIMLNLVLSPEPVRLDSIPAWVFYKDKENRFIRINKAFTDVMKMSKEQLERRSLPDLYPKEQSEITERKRVEEVLLSRERELTDAVKLPND